MVIKEIAYYEYFFFCSEFSTPLSDYYVKSAIESGGMILLAAYDDAEAGSGGPSGCCIMHKAGFKHFSLDYILVKEERQGIGFGRELLAAAINHAKEQGSLCVSARVINNYKDSNTLGIADGLLLAYGFQTTQTSMVIRCSVDKKSSNTWSEFMDKKGKRFMERSEKKEFNVVSFAEAGELVDELKKRIGKEFAAELNPEFYINNTVDKLISELSFIAVKDAVPAAYCIATTVDGKKVVFQQLSVAQKYQRTGVFFLPFAAFMKKMFSDNMYSKVSYTVYDANTEMKSLVEGFLNPLIESRKMQNFYRYDIKSNL